MISLIATLAAALALSPGTAQAQFQLGLQGVPASSTAGYLAQTTVNGSVARINVGWATVAGDTATEPAGFDTSNPADPHYRWTTVDAAVRRAAQYHLQVLLMLFDAPAWAEGPGLPVGNPQLGPGSWRPNPILYGQFVRAAAERYDGQFPDPLHAGASLPRVKDFEIWNEPNLWRYVAGPDTVGQFRSLLSAGYKAVKAVHPDNKVVLGGLAPISPQLQFSSHPLTFAAQLLCLRHAGKRYVRTAHCQKVSFDAFGIHPYTLAATPTKPAENPNDILVADTWKVRALVRAAERLHTINSGPHPIWNTEWSWFTNPPQPLYGDPPSVAARYVAYSLYAMWRAGVSVVVWQGLIDTSGGPNPGGSLETSAGAPKQTLFAFAFPFVASVGRGRGYGWGRAPFRHKVKVFVQHQVKGKWRRVATAHTDGYGMFQVRFKAHGNGTYRALVAHGGPTSLPYYSAKIPPKRTHPYAFG